MENLLQVFGKPTIPKLRCLFDVIYHHLCQDGYCRKCPTDSGIYNIFLSSDGAARLAADGIYLPLNEHDKHELIDQAVSLYLMVWLEQDANAKQTLNSFADRVFCTVNERKHCFGGAAISPAERSLLQRAENKFRDMVHLVPAQAEKEEIRYRQEPIWKSREKHLYQVNEADGISEKRSPNGGNYYGFKDLCFIGWIADNKFSFYNLLVYGKRFLSKSNMPRNQAIRDTYNEYFEAIKGLEKCTDDCTYTVTVMMLQYIEATFGHMAAACLAQIVSGRSIEDMLSDSSPWWGRYECESFFSPQSRPLLDMPYGNFFTHHDMLSAMTGSSEDLPFRQQKQLLRRGILTEMLNFAICSWNPCRCEWTEADYHVAAKFFREEYMIVGNHASTGIPAPSSWSDEACDFIRAFYRSIYGYGLEELRRESQAAQKQRNTRKVKEDS